MREDDLLLLKRELERIKSIGWVKNRRPGNSGGVGNTLEDLLDVAENNYQLPDFGEWELKSQRAETGSLLTLFHIEPKPRSAKIIPHILLPKYGWAHQGAGAAYPLSEKSFRQTISTTIYSDRGFRVTVDNEQQKIFVSFDFSRIDERHSEWKAFIENGVGVGDINPSPFWTFDDIQNKLDTKIYNLMYVQADTKIENGEEFFKYKRFEAHTDPTLDRFLNLINSGYIYIDFDARTGHNHGTKFRIKPAKKVELYKNHIIV